MHIQISNLNLKLFYSTNNATLIELCIQELHFQ